jgi:hypothetical protein
LGIRPYTGNNARHGGLALQLVLALMANCPVSAHAANEGGVSAGSSSSRSTPHYRGANHEDRVKVLTQALGLDAKQQLELRKVLEGQRDQIRRVWDDESVPAAYRIIATQSISDKTADQIRALLNEEQRKKYKPPRPEPGAAVGSAQPSVEDWMKAAKSK